MLKRVFYRSKANIKNYSNYFVYFFLQDLAQNIQFSLSIILTHITYFFVQFFALFSLIFLCNNNTFQLYEKTHYYSMLLLHFSMLILYQILPLLALLFSTLAP